MMMLRQLPNVLTVLRLAAAPVIAFLLLQHDYVAALAVFAFAGLSDAADGFLAKRFGLDTRFGALADPIADKFLMLASFIALTIIEVTPWQLTALVLARDVAIVAAVLLAKALGWPLRVQPQLLGKISTAIQVIYVGLTLLMLAASIDMPDVTYWAAVITAVVTLASWLSYGHIWLRAFAFRHSRPA